MALTKSEIIASLGQELQKAIDDEILRTMMSMSNKEPRLKFKRVNDRPYVLEYGMEYNPGTFTPTGLRDHHLTDIRDWCADNDCGEFIDMYKIAFRSEKEMAWFMLRWS